MVCAYLCAYWGTEFEGSFVVSDGLVVDAIVELDFIQKHNCVIQDWLRGGGGGGFTGGAAH